MGDDEVAVLIFLADALRRPPGHRLVVQSVEPTGPLQIGDAGDAGLGHQFIHRYRVHHKGRGADLVADLLGQHRSQIGGVFAMDRAAQVLHHPVVHRIGAAGDGVHQAAPPRHRGKGTDLKARLLQRLQDDVLPVAKLIKYMGKSLQILPGVGDILLEQFLFVFKYCNLGAGATRINNQYFHSHPPCE